MKNINVIEKFIAEREANTKSLRSNGMTLLSYNEIIGFHLNGQVYAIDYTSTGRFLSQTTSTHVNMLKRQSGVKTVSPQEWDMMFRKFFGNH